VGPYDVTVPNPVTNKEFGKALGRALGRPSAIPTPAFAMHTALGEVASIVLEGQRAVPQRLQELDLTFRLEDIDIAFDD
jgi:hypothetical protein